MIMSHYECLILHNNYLIYVFVSASNCKWSSSANRTSAQSTSITKLSFGVLTRDPFIRHTNTSVTIEVDEDLFLVVRCVWCLPLTQNHYFLFYFFIADCWIVWLLTIFHCLCAYEVRRASARRVRVFGFDMSNRITTQSYRFCCLRFCDNRIDRGSNHSDDYVCVDSNENVAIAHFAYCVSLTLKEFMNFIK